MIKIWGFQNLNPSRRRIYMRNDIHWTPDPSIEIMKEQKRKWRGGDDDRKDDAGVIHVWSWPRVYVVKIASSWCHSMKRFLPRLPPDDGPEGGTWIFLCRDGNEGIESAVFRSFIRIASRFCILELLLEREDRMRMNPSRAARHSCKVKLLWTLHKWEENEQELRRSWQVKEEEIEQEWT